MSTPRHSGTVERPSRSPRRSTSDPPIYRTLVKDLYGEGAAGPLADLDLRLLQDVLDGLRNLGKGTPAGRVSRDARQPEVISGELPTGKRAELPKRTPRQVPPPNVRQHMSGVRGVPRVPEARQPVNPAGWFQEPDRPQPPVSSQRLDRSEAVCGGGR